MTIPASITHAIQTTQNWLNELTEKGELADTQEALNVLRAVFHALRDMLPNDEAVNLAAQLPLILRGFYYEGWRPHKQSPTIWSKQQFVDAVVANRLPNAVPVVPAISAVFAVLAHHCEPNQISQIVIELPPQIRALWPDTAQALVTTPN